MFSRPLVILGLVISDLLLLILTGTLAQLRKAGFAHTVYTEHGLLSATSMAS